MSATGNEAAAFACGVLAGAVDALLLLRVLGWRRCDHHPTPKEGKHAQHRR